MRELKHAHLVPREPAKNLEWRQSLLELAKHGGANKLWQMCREDPAFYINSFVWTLDSLRHADAPALPFILYPYQEDGLLQMDEAIGHHDVVIRKSRDMGATWLILALFEWRWHFWEAQSFLIASRDASYVDAATNPKALFAKLDYILSQEPRWLQPKFTRRKMSLFNNDTQSVINGESATGELGRGDKRAAMLWDETAAWEKSDGYNAMRSTSATTACRIINSTPQGQGNAYADMLKTTQHRLTFHWSEHPLKRRGLYTAKDGVLELLDKDYKHPAGYNFVLDGEYPKRSPWFDEWCAAHGNIRSMIAQELEMDLAGSSSLFFDVDLIGRLIAKTTTPPLHIGDLTYSVDGHPGEWCETINGKTRLWCTPCNGKLPPGPYCVGCDIAAGTGASNSVLVVAHCVTGEKVLEYASSHTRPEEFAVFALAVCRWAHNAYLIWEALGPGRQFGARLIELGIRLGGGIGRRA